MTPALAAQEGSRIMADALRVGPYVLVAGRLAAPPSVGSTIVWLEHFSLRPDERVGASSGPSSPRRPAARRDPMISWASDADIGRTAGARVLRAAAEVPAGYVVTDVRVGFGIASRTFVAQIHLAPVAGPAKTAVVVLGDDPEGSDLGPLFVDSATAAAHPAKRPTLLCLRLDAAGTADRVVVGGLTLCLAPI
jgi:hypothetical protein